ncbi:hypothetical protein ACTUM7_03500 [Basfia succiniciproducens]|uniref:hypothetical protein n=1 Tax=Basfia TaxID=697331 RepID=UPI0005A2C029|nr:hypothetical protein [[Mannheimia] succiniciproducens]
MKRIALIFITTMIAFNIGALIVWLRNYGLSLSFDSIIKAHYAVSIYALKCSVIGVVVDWISKDWFKKDDK